MERELRRLAHRPQEQQQGGGGSDALAHGPALGGGKGIGHTETAHFPPQQQNANQQAHIPNPGNDKGFLGRFPGLPPLKPEPD